MLSRVENENACKVAWVVQVNKVRTMITILREEATSALAGFHAGLLSWSNWNLEILFFCGRRKAKEPGEKPSEQGENQQQTAPPTYGTGPESKGFGYVGMAVSRSWDFGNRE